MSHFLIPSKAQDLFILRAPRRCRLKGSFSFGFLPHQEDILLPGIPFWRAPGIEKSADVGPYLRLPNWGPGVQDQCLLTALSLLSRRGGHGDWKGGRVQSRRGDVETDAWLVPLRAARRSEHRLREYSKITRPLLVPQRFDWVHMGSLYLFSGFSVPEFQRVVRRVSSWFLGSLTSKRLFLVSNHLEDISLRSPVGSQSYGDSPTPSVLGVLHLLW